MKIIIDDLAKETFEFQNVKTVTIYGVLPVGCWGIQRPEVYVRLREPKSNQNVEDFDLYNVEGINFYIDKELELEDTITVKKARFVSDLPEHDFIIEGQI